MILIKDLGNLQVYFSTLCNSKSKFIVGVTDNEIVFCIAIISDNFSDSNISVELRGLVYDTFLVINFSGIHKSDSYLYLSLTDYEIKEIG